MTTKASIDTANREAELLRIKRIASIVKSLTKTIEQSPASSTELARQAEDLLALANANTMEIRLSEGALRFHCNNTATHMRAETLFTKEPETLAWIDTIPHGSVLWDIGANIGIYSLYAAKTRNCTVYAFEPSIFNLEVLGRNIFINEGSARAP